jgi:hypothetical protein
MTTYLALHGIHALAPNYINSDDGSAIATMVPQ